MTKKELATVAGYTYRRLYDIDKALPPNQKLFVQSEDGKYDLALFVQRWVRYNLEKTDDSADMTLEEAKTAHEKLKMQKTRLEVERMKGQLVDVSAVQKLWGDVITTCVQQMMRIASKVAPRLLMLDSTSAISAIIDAEVRSVLNGISQTPLPEEAILPETEDEEDDE